MYPAIEDHGIIGNLRTVALVSLDGTIDFFCPLRFDNPTLFASLLDDERGGFCSLHPTSDHYRHKQLYLPETNVLITRFLAPEGIAEIVDFMPLGGPAEQCTIFRRVTVTRGELELRFECFPAFNYGSDLAFEIDTSNGIRFLASNLQVLHVQSNVQLSAEKNRAVTTFRMKAGEFATFALSYIQGSPTESAPRPEQSEQALAETVQYWRNWVADCSYRGRWRETVVRSALLLKLLTYEPSGAIVAAPTFGLPEEIGGVRNWDYRYTWLRDAAFSLGAFLSLGYQNEVVQFMLWLKGIGAKQDFAAARRQQLPLPVMHPIDGVRDVHEREIHSLRGYRGSRPVRIGNAVRSQLQLDGPGSMISVLYFEVNAGMMIEYDRWKRTREVLDWLSTMWNKPDQGIWETRAEPKQFLYSKLMCWVAFDRAIKIAQIRSLPAPVADWVKVRDEIYERIHRDFWNEELQSFVQFEGGSELDASTLLMLPVGFISPSDARWLSTLDAINAKLSLDTAIIRYDPRSGVDGLPGIEGAFTPCSFWYINALAMTGKIDRARLLFDKMLGYSNHLGLYAEELGLSGEHLGNFPQALTHLALIQSALYLNEALDKKSHIGINPA